MIRIFRHYVPTPLLFLAVAEAVILFLSVYAGVHLRFSSSKAGYAELIVGPVLPKALIFSIAMLSIMTAVGLYQRDLRDNDWSYYSRFGLSFLVGLAVMALVFYAVPSLFLGRGAFGFAFGIAFVGTLIARFLFLKWVNFDVVKRRILVLGTGTRAGRVESLARSSKGRHRFTVVGYLPLQGATHALDKNNVLPDKESLLSIAQKYEVDEIVVGVRDRRNGGMPVQELLDCKLAGYRVVDLSTFFERETGHVQLDSLNSSWMIFSEGFIQTSLREVVKRLFDVMVSGIILAITAPIMAITAVLIRLESKGPVFYRQERVGEHGKKFEVLKFRSMRVDAEKDGVPQWAKKNDDRTTRVGKVIRTLRIDELPQIFNVFRGDMSFVGPRPERPFFVKQLAEKINYYSCRHAVKPGITGWAQVRYPYGASIEDAQHKLQYDLYYVKNHSLFLDLIILFQTAQVVLFGKGAR